jgi:hypothetical protein
MLEDKNSPEYWEQMLAKDWFWDIDEAEDFFSEKVIQVVDSPKVEVFNQTDLLIEEIEKEKNIKIRLNPRKSSIELFSKEWLDIWKMEKTIYTSKDFHTTEHMMIEIEHRFRGKWFWKIMYEIYETIAKSDNRFFLPYIEHTQKSSTINLYRKFWFIPTKKIIKNIEYDLDKNDLFEIDSILENIKKWETEINLEYTIKLEKILSLEI